MFGHCGMMTVARDATVNNDAQSFGLLAMVARQRRRRWDGARRRLVETIRPRPKRRRWPRRGRGANIGAMNESVQIAEIAALVGDPPRANMLRALLDGRALTAGALAYAAGVAAQTTSGHLGQLTDARPLRARK